MKKFRCSPAHGSSRIPKPPQTRREILMSRVFTPIDEQLDLYKRASVPDASRLSPMSPKVEGEARQPPLCNQQFSQLQEELSSYRGLVLGWKRRCDIAEEALMHRNEECQSLLCDVHSLERRLDSIQQLLTSQNAQLRVRDSRSEWLSSLALLMSVASIGLIFAHARS